MSCVKLIYSTLFIILMGLALSACNDLTNDLLPSSSDKRATVIAGSTGNQPGQIAANFIIKDSLNNDFILADYLTGGSQPTDVVVLYFTMWCPVCLSHSDHIYNTVMPQFNARGNVIYGLVDYVSGSVSATRASEVANGYAGSDFIALSDIDQSLFNQLNGSMGVIIVIDNDGTILLNEDFRNGQALQTILDQQLP